MYALALSCVVFATCHVLAEPVPVIHDRLIRRCDNHTGLSIAPYASSANPEASPSITATMLSSWSATPSPLVNTTADSTGISAVGASSSSSADSTGTSLTTPFPAEISFPSSGLASGMPTISNGTWGMATATGPQSSGTASTSTTLCLGSGCTALPSPSSSEISAAATSGSAMQSAVPLSSTITVNSILPITFSTGSVTITVNSVLPALSSSGSVGLPGSTDASAASFSLQTITIESVPLATVVTSSVTETFTSTVTGSNPSMACIGYAYDCMPQFSNTFIASAAGSTTAGAIGTSSTTTSDVAAMSSLGDSAMPTTITIDITSSETSTVLGSNSSWPTSSSFSVISSAYLSYTFDTTSPLTAPITIVAASTSVTTDLLPIGTTGGSASASVPSGVNTNIWSAWNLSAIAQATDSMPTTFATSFTSSNSTGASPTGGLSALNSTNPLAEVEAEATYLANDSVGLIEKIDSLLATLGAKKRRASKHAV